MNEILANFKIKLGEAYYNQGIINPGVMASKYLGHNGVPISLNLPNGIILESTINRNANINHSVRAYFGNDLIEFMHQNYNLGDVLNAVVKPNNVIEIL